MRLGLWVVLLVCSLSSFISLLCLSRVALVYTSKDRDRTERKADNEPWEANDVVL